HEDVSEHLEVLKEVLGFLFEEKAWIKIKPIEDFFKRNLIEHFKFEEEIVFPPVLSQAATPDSIKLILELQREHGSILKELEEFQNIISKNAFPLDKETGKRLNVVGRNILNSLLPHASKEDDKLLPILKENIHIFDKHDFI
ncbi:MAG: hemerythrin domain-containing protein, partial [bacterium]